MHPDPSSEDMPTLFQRLAVRNGEAFGEIWRRLRGKLLVFAKYRVQREADLCPVYDEEDAVGSGMRIMWVRLMQGHVVPPDGVDEFLRLARTIISRRITAKLRELRADKRSPSVKGNVHGGFQFQGRFVPDDLDLCTYDLTGPEEKAVFEDFERWLLGLLGPWLREIAEARLEGRTIDQIAKRRGKSRRAIERMFEEIRAIWSSALRDT
jgi:DNA-directed RNA polymerase specialized sigma24 family protein